MRIQTKIPGKQLFVLLWVAFSIIYISWDIYNDVIVNMYNKGFLQGKAFAINSLIQETEKEDCQPIPIFNDQKKVYVINVECLQTVDGDNPTNDS